MSYFTFLAILYLLKSDITDSILIFIIISLGSILIYRYHKDNMAIIITISVVLIVSLIFILSYNAMLQQRATITSHEVIKNNNYVLNGTINIDSNTIYQNLTLYNITPIFLNISTHGANFVYFKLYKNITSTKGISNLIKNYSLPGYTHGPKNYSCAYSSEFICNEMNISIENTTMSYIIIKGITSQKIRPLIPLELGPLSYTKTDKVVNVTKPIYTCNKSSSLCDINFSITNNVNRSISINSLAIPLSYQKYNLSNAYVSVNSVNSKCFKIIPGYKIECNENDDGSTSFISIGYNSHGIGIISFSLISLPNKSKVNVTISINITT